MDYEALGFKAGLEIHQQLDTHKLFCACPSMITDHVDYSFERELRPTTSEMGTVDQAALAEAKRNRRFVYCASDTATCMVDTDEEPPHSPNHTAVDIALTVATLLHAQPVDEIQFMRKIVIDGSTTSGFQRTALVALDGYLGNVTIETVSLEEDAARTLDEGEGMVHYGLDRLGIPLIEIVTGPDIRSPQEAGEVALCIGRLLRATKNVRRGIGTIRQDINVSIDTGNRVEIKGVQELKNIPILLENEVKRQMEMLAIAQKMQKRCDRTFLEQQKVVDISKVIKNTASNKIQSALGKDGVVCALRLPNCADLIGGVTHKQHRLGNELADIARIWGGGIIHSDELPAFGISKTEVRAMEKCLSCNPEDAFVLSIGTETEVNRLLKEILCRIVQAMDGVLQEVRRARPDGMTAYMRPLPGAARMYPETDVPPILIGEDKMMRIVECLPEIPENKVIRYQWHGLSSEESWQIVNGDCDDWFDSLIEAFPEEGKHIARILLHTLPELEKEGVPRGAIDVVTVKQVLEALSDGSFAKEGIPRILSYLVQSPDASVLEAIDACSVQALNEDQVRKKIREIIDENQDLIAKKGKHSSGTLMGFAMEKMRGKADGALIHRVLNEELERGID